MKKRLQRRGARKGFTLVELLIVIIIIGILAGGMMLVAGGGRDAAEASKIISDLRTMKSAALMWMTENPAGDVKTMWAGLEEDPTPLNAYLDRPILKDLHNFEFVSDGKLTKSEITGYETEVVNGQDVEVPVYNTVEIDDALLLGYDLKDVRDGVKINLEKQAKSAGLYGGKEIDLSGVNPDAVGFYTKDQPIVYVIIQ
jgi:general secretion pathway protein G